MKLLFFLLGCCLVPLAQLSGIQNAQGTALNPAVPTVTFDSIWQSATPQEYVITTRSDGISTYLSRNPLGRIQAEEEGAGKIDKRWQNEETPATPETKSSQDNDPDYHVEFTMSPATAQRIFKDAEKANYFNGSFDYTKHQVASTGRKTLTYADPIRHFQTTFDYSENNAVEDLAKLFLAISNTIEYGRKLEFKHKYDKLGLEDDLKAMEDAMENHNLAELQVIAPALQSIADDSSVMNIARQRAKRLLKKAGGK
jgi:hypothetical protein